MNAAGAALALAASFCFAIALVLGRVGLARYPVRRAAATTLPSATLLLWLLAPVTVRWDGFDPGAALIFAAVGAVFPIGVTYLVFSANRHMGPSLAGALGNTTPLFALGFAVLLLGEHLSAARGAGVAILLGGVALLTLPTRGGEARFPAWVIALPLVAAALRGLVQPVVKYGLTLWPDPFAASLCGYTVSAAIAFALGGARLSMPGHDRLLFLLVGIGNAAAVLLLYAALAHAPVALVAPLVATYPLFTLAFSALLLREERLERRLLAGIALTVAGVVVVLAG